MKRTHWQCWPVVDRKNAFVGSTEEVVDFLKFNRNHVFLETGKERFLTHSFVWQIPLNSGGCVQRRMSHLISSGIYWVWERVHNNAKTREHLYISLKKTMEKKESLDTKLGALFKLLLCSSSICFSVFVAESVLFLTMEAAVVLKGTFSKAK
jgi:hypothetical protein